MTVRAALESDIDAVGRIYDKLHTAEENGSAVMVLHTLVVDPDKKRRGYGRAFLDFYENYARENGCAVLRIDTNARNAAARKMYAAFGWREAGIVPCSFNGLPGVQLVCLEKPL